MAIIKKSLFCLISFFIFSFCFAYEIDLLSPKKGEWSNKQMLVINDLKTLWLFYIAAMSFWLYC